jgi:hypothetical protein
VNQLPKVKIGNKTYFIDERLNELRNIKDFMDKESIELAYAYREKWFWMRTKTEKVSSKSLVVTMDKTKTIFIKKLKLKYGIKKVAIDTYCTKLIRHGFKRIDEDNALTYVKAENGLSRMIRFAKSDLKFVQVAEKVNLFEVLELWSVLYTERRLKKSAMDTSVGNV